MVNYLTKEQERFLLLKKVFRNPYPGDVSSLALFKLGRELKLEYCGSFKDNGYDERYAGFETDKVIREVADNIGDQRFIKLFEDDKGELSEYASFYGKYHTYDSRTKTLALSSSWTEIKNEISSVLIRYPSNGKIVLDAIYEVNFKKNKIWKNYYEVMTMAKNKGLTSNWQNIISEYILIGIIDDRKNIRITEEMRPLVEEVLGV